jgi:hypothetical protein
MATLFIGEVAVAPDTPSAGNAVLYVKTADHGLYIKDSTGAESAVGGAVSSLDSGTEIIAEGNTTTGESGNIRLRAYNGALVVEKSDGAGGWLEGPVFSSFSA